jgi:hypothetical protein
MIFCCLATPPDVSVTARKQSGVTRVLRILVSPKMTECLEQQYCIKFCQKPGDTKAETIRKIQQAFGDDAIGSLKLMSGSTTLKMAACRGTVTGVLGDRQQAKILISLTKCGHRLWRTVV